MRKCSHKDLELHSFRITVHRSDLNTLNWDSHIRVTHNAAPSFPDVSIVSRSNPHHLIMVVNDYDSDLRPFTNSQMESLITPSPNRTHVHLKKANWKRYIQEIKIPPPLDCQRDEEVLRSVLLTAEAHHIQTVHYIINIKCLQASSIS